MDELFAPWRIDWVERDPEERNAEATCVFCDLPGRSSDRESRIVARSEHAYVLLNNYPYSPGHVMVIPFVHEGDYVVLDDSVLADQARLQQRTVRAIRATLDPDGLNVGLNLGEGAGGSVRDHLHTHIVPRWIGDTNFMPVISDTRVIVEALDDTYDRLHAAFAEQEGTRAEGMETAVRVQTAEE